MVVRWGVALAMLGASALAWGADGAEILSKMDEATNRYTDQIIRFEVVNQEPGKQDPRTMGFTVQLKGEQSLTSFTAPADLNGTRVLVLARNQMYVYLPQYNKVRRIASHVTKQGFMGTTYSHDDMSAVRFGDVYEATLLSTEGAVATLELKPKGDGAPYERAEIDVDTERSLPLVIRYYNDKGTHLKTEKRTDYECREEVCLPTVMRMDDHTRNGAWTELRMAEWELNPGLSSDVFSVRNLQRGE